MRINDSRLVKIERALEKTINKNTPCYAFTIHNLGATDEQIIQALYKYKGLTVTIKEFSKWKRFYNSDDIVVMSPNFTIDKYILQQRNN